ncbi:MAG: acetylglutamate kinase [Actinobacteria bacterium]|nr:acetylglutamate kinase [Actinomycetota bacterium]
MKEAAKKAAILTEALPYIKKHYGKTVVIKYGGNVMLTENLKKSFATDIALMKFVGINPVVIHGGGPEISKEMKRLNYEIKFVDGLRVTDKNTMKIVKSVLVGKINKELVELINQHGKIAKGLSGESSSMIIAKKKEFSSGIDLGYVGEVVKINAKIIEDLINKGLIPVIATIGVDKKGEIYNINADLVAGEIAAALDADKIIFMTNIEGIYEDFENKKGLISELSLGRCEGILKNREIGEGMFPKVEGCVKALKSKVNRAHILDGRIEHAILLEVFTDKGIGTMIFK